MGISERMRESCVCVSLNKQDKHFLFTSLSSLGVAACPPVAPHERESPPYCPHAVLNMQDHRFLCN